MESILRSLTGQDPNPDDYRNIEFWSDPERSGGKLLWFKERSVTRGSIPRGVVPVGKCLTVKGAEDVLNKPYAFELSTSQETMYFIADSEKEKEEWINSIGRSIVQHSRSVTDSEIVDYDSTR
ncbi:Pleckstrin domain-containing protein [Salix suchowensis]|nr:Pleckstrin domain-containing protein [Salix suchowensis]